MRWKKRLALLLAVCAGGLHGQEKPPYTFGTTVVSTTGFEGRIYLLKAHTGKLPHFDHMEPTGTIYTNTLNVWPQRFTEAFPGITDRIEWFAIDYHGHFWIEHEGEYRFSLLSDDGSRLYVDHQELVDNDGIHSATALSARAVLTRGMHAIQVSYFQGPRFTVALVLAVAGPAAEWRIFNTDDFIPPVNSADWVTGRIRDIHHSVPFGGDDSPEETPRKRRR
ncbi:MAG TPA: PA14 domain-containing protein [Bryobacteraceae bacterium]|nr:PA14 domain-containing protein [Bryobacteraceae bacterium]